MIVYRFKMIKFSYIMFKVLVWNLFPIFAIIW